MKDDLAAGIKKAGVQSADRHVFLCMGPDCCSPVQAELLWEHVKQRIRESDVKAMRTKAQCFRICVNGPWLVVYPEGVWYGDMSPEKFDRILQEHLIDGKVVTEWVSVRNCLG